MVRVLGAESRTVVPWTMATFLMRPVWEVRGSVKTILFLPWVTMEVMSKGPKLTQVSS